MTKKPCPGCGEIHPRRKADEICSRCKSLLEKARAIAEAEGALEGGDVFVRFGERYHWNEYIHTYQALDSRGLMEAFHKLALAASKPSINNYWEDSDLRILGKPDGGGKRFLMNKGIAEAILDLRSIVQDVIDSVYKKGKSDGHNLLMRLASGDLGPNEYMTKTRSR